MHAHGGMRMAAGCAHRLESRQGGHCLLRPGWCHEACRAAGWTAAGDGPQQQAAVDGAKLHSAGSAAFCQVHACPCPTGGADVADTAGMGPTSLHRPIGAACELVQLTQVQDCAAQGASSGKGSGRLVRAQQTLSNSGGGDVSSPPLMSGIIARSSRRLASQCRTLSSMAFTTARPGEPTPAISDAHRGPTGVLEVNGRAENPRCLRPR